MADCAELTSVFIYSNTASVYSLTNLVYSSSLHRNINHSNLVQLAITSATGRPTFPPISHMMPNLRYLNIDCYITKDNFIDFHSLKNLETLVIRYASTVGLTIEEMDQIDDLKLLKKLDISRSTISDAFRCRYPNLQQFTFDSVKLYPSPSSPDQFRNLFECSRNIAYETFIFPSQWSFTEFPKLADIFPNLTSLYANLATILVQDPISFPTIPDDYFPSSLEIIDVSRLQITLSLDLWKLQNLKLLIASGNKFPENLMIGFRSLSSSFFSFECNSCSIFSGLGSISGDSPVLLSLEKLSLEDNLLQELYNFNSSFENVLMPSLKELKLSGNRLIHLKELERFAPNLLLLSAQNNQLNYISNFPRSLKTLLISNNLLSRIPFTSTILPLPFLSELRVDNNSLFLNSKFLLFNSSSISVRMFFFELVK